MSGPNCTWGHDIEEVGRICNSQFVVATADIGDDDQQVSARSADVADPARRDNTPSGKPSKFTFPLACQHAATLTTVSSHP